MIIDNAKSVFIFYGELAALHKMFKKSITAVNNIFISPVEIPGVPGVCNLPWVSGEVQQAIDLVVRVCADNPEHIANIPLIHADKIIIFLIVFFCHLYGAVGKHGETLWTRTQKADHEMGLLTTNKG